MLSMTHASRNFCVIYLLCVFKHVCMAQSAINKDEE